MMTPGADLLSIALTVINPQEVLYRRFLGQELNEARIKVDKWEVPFTIFGSVQRVKRDKYAELGLDFSRRYVTLYASLDIKDIHRENNGDQFNFGDRTYQVVSDGNWFLMDGWASCIAVDIGPRKFEEPEPDPEPGP